MRIGLWCCQWELGFDVANENWVLNSANVSWALMLPMKTLMLPMRIGVWCCQWELGFDVANENWVLNSANVS